VAKDVEEELGPADEVIGFVVAMTRSGPRGRALRRLGRWCAKALLWGSAISAMFAIGEIKALGLAKAFHEYGRWWFGLAALAVGVPIALLLGFAVLEKVLGLAAFSAKFALETTTGLISPRARASTPTISRILLFAVGGFFIAWWGFNIATDDLAPKTSKPGVPVLTPVVRDDGPSPLGRVLPYVGVWVVGVISGAMSDVVKEQLKKRLHRSEPRSVQLLGADGNPIAPGE